MMMSKIAIGEIANKVAGNLKVSCSKIGVSVELVIPTSIAGEAFYVGGSADAQQITVPLKMVDETFWVELIYGVNS